MAAPVLNPHAELTPELLITRLRHQLEDDCRLGVIQPCPENDVDRIIAESVTDLWETSKVKTFLPVLALRRARDKIRDLAAQHAPTTAPS